MKFKDIFQIFMRKVIIKIKRFILFAILIFCTDKMHPMDLCIPNPQEEKINCNYVMYNFVNFRNCCLCFNLTEARQDFTILIKSYLTLYVGSHLFQLPSNLLMNIVDFMNPMDEQIIACFFTLNKKGLRAFEFLSKFCAFLTVKDIYGEKYGDAYFNTCESLPKTLKYTYILPPFNNICICVPEPRFKYDCEWHKYESLRKLLREHSYPAPLDPLFLNKPDFKLILPSHGIFTKIDYVYGHNLLHIKQRRNASRFKGMDRMTLNTILVLPPITNLDPIVELMHENIQSIYFTHPKKNDDGNISFDNIYTTFCSDKFSGLNLFQAIFDKFPNIIINLPCSLNIYNENYRILAQVANAHRNSKFSQIFNINNVEFTEIKEHGILLVHLKTVTETKLEEMSNHVSHVKILCLSDVEGLSDAHLKTIPLYFKYLEKIILGNGFENLNLTYEGISSMITNLPNLQAFSMDELRRSIGNKLKNEFKKITFNFEDV